jgi:hypothetical protein
MYTALVFAALTVGTLSSSPSWLDDYKAAQAQVSNAHKPMAVFVGSGKAGWEGAVRDGFDPAISKLLAEKFVCLYVDASTIQGQKLASAFQVGNRGVVLSDRTGLTQAYSATGTISRTELNRALVVYSDVEVAQKTDTPKVSGSASGTGASGTVSGPGGTVSGGTVITGPGGAVITGPGGPMMAPPPGYMPGPMMMGGPGYVGGPGYMGGYGGGCGQQMGGCGGGSKCGMGGGCGQPMGGCGQSSMGCGQKSHGCCFFGGGGWGGGHGGCGGGMGHGCGGGFGGWGGGWGGGMGHGCGGCK